MIRITFYEHEMPYLTFTDRVDMATAYAQYAQLCGYGLTREAI